LISDATTCITSASSRSRPFSTSLFMIAAFNIRSGDSRSAFWAFIAAVISAATLWFKLISDPVPNRRW
jgi:hypothetical protein